MSRTGKSIDRQSSGCLRLRGTEGLVTKKSGASFWPNDNVLKIDFCGDGGIMLNIPKSH